MNKTPAELQIELLRRLKEGKTPRQSASSPREARDERARPGRGPSHAGLAISPALWRKLVARQRELKEFKNRRDMGDWAADLLLALPAYSRPADTAARESFLARLALWAASHNGD